MKRISAFLLISMFILVFITGCGSSKEEAIMMDTMTEESRGEAPSNAGAMKESTLGFEGEVQTDSDYSDESEEVDSDSESINPLQNRKIIMTGNAYIETLEFDNTLSQLEAMVIKYNGYIASSNSGGRSLYNNDEETQRFANYVIKIPAKNFYDVFNEFGNIGNVLNKDKNMNDVTSQFIDVDARLKTLGIQEERLLSILDKAARLNDIIELEYALQNVRFEIERYTATMRNLEEKVQFSTITLRIQEVYEETILDKPAITFGERITGGFRNTLKDIKTGGENILIFIVINLPYLIFWVVIIIIITVWIKKLGRKKNAKKINAEKIKESTVVEDSKKEE